jgi:hypothetical protein
MLIYIDSAGRPRSLCLAKEEAADFGRMIITGILINACILDGAGNIIPEYICSAISAPNPEDDPDQGDAIRKIREKAKEFAFWARVYNGTLTLEFLWRNQDLIPLYHQVISRPGGREAIEKLMEKSRQDPSLLYSPVAFKDIPPPETP